MRKIEKTEPESIREWKTIQEPVEVNLDYDDGFTRKPQLRQELIAEQFGLCGYTGAPIDDRLDGIADAEENLAFQPHIEHIKSQAQCRTELTAIHGPDAWGRVIAEDMDYMNLIAALEVNNKPPAKSEVFGAAASKDKQPPVSPVQDGCEERFQFGRFGAIAGLDGDAEKTIDVLKLDHGTLEGWRRGAIDGFFIDENGDEIAYDRADIERLIEVLDTPQDGQLAEFSFCIRGYCRSLL